MQLDIHAPEKQKSSYGKGGHQGYIHGLDIYYEKSKLY
ncbi:hypothetical protein RU85_GL000138 [Lactococcus garvieae]|nr:hypothetical protein RU85_GL000138 [Lactococcus garvieae]